MILKYLFIFSIFSVIGWVLELFYRGLRSKKIINPGFMVGCVVPLYGFGAVILDILCNIFNKIDFNYKTITIFVLGVILLSILELIAGIILLKIFKIRLWDYSTYDFNYKGYICLQYSLMWGFLTLIFYNFIFPYIDVISNILVNSIISIFLLGIFIGVFIIDLCFSIGLSSKIHKYSKIIADIVNLENLKLELKKKQTTKNLLSSLFPYIITNKYIKESIHKKQSK